MIVPQRVPENFVRPTVTSSLSERLNAISSQILSRTRLERIINEFNLYPEQRETELMEDVVAQMRRDLGIGIARRGRRVVESFTVSFESESRQLAMQVAQRLASLFIQENLEDRELQADSTTRFLESQLESARRGLEEHEQILEEYRRRFNGELPSQLGANTQLMQNVQTRLQALSEGMTRDQEQLLTLGRLSSEASGRLELDSSTVIDLDQLPADAPAAIQLEVARAGLRNLELRLKPEHPDVIRAKQVIAGLEVRAEAEALSQPLVEGPEGPGTSRDPRREQISAYQREVATIERRLAAGQEEQTELQQSLLDYQSRIQATPARESDLTEITRDYETLRSNYTGLLQKSEAARLSLNLERRQIGEQFRMLDAARLPERPISPDRLQLVTTAAMMGLGFGVGLTLLLEYRNTSLRKHEDVVAALSLPVLAVVPLMTSRREQRHQRTVWWTGVATAATAIIGLIAAAWRLDLFQTLLP